MANKKELNPKQEKFCQLYATETEFFGNGVQTACSSSSQLLSNIKVCNRINELLEDGGLNDAHVDKQLLFIINQFDNLPAKTAAIREYNKLKSRITEKQEVTHNINPITELSVEELKKLAE